MSLFSMGENGVRYAVLVDIGSGSVLASIAASDPDKTHPDIIWSKREYSPFREKDEMSTGAKSVMTSLMNVFMALDSEGRKAFRESTGENRFPYLFVTIAAPWSYTVTKTISYKQEKEFLISDSLISELLYASQKKVMEELKENEKMHDLGLSIISRTTTDIVSNGYQIQVTGKQKAKSLKVVQSTAITQEKLVTAIEDVQDKVLPKAELLQYSFMLIFFYVMREMYPDSSEFCLIDITYEATEIGVVREGVLQYCTHAPYGSFSLAREISKILSIPLEEAYKFLNQSEEEMEVSLAKYSVEKKKDIAVIFGRYQEQLIKLLNETGDSLSIPKKIFLHGDLHSEPFFKRQIIEAANAATGSSHAVYTVSADLLTKNYSEKAQENLKNSNQDTALLISAQFFHTQDYNSTFEQL